MAEPRDIAVIGAGVVGICCARVLQRQGHRVTVFDPEPPGSGASFGNAGHIAIDHIRPLARPDVLRGVPRMLVDPLGPLAIRWRDMPVLAPWLARFALAARPAQVRRGTTALADLLRGSAAAWAEEVRGSNLAGLFRAKGALVVYDSDRGFAAAAGERALLQAHGIAVETMGGDAARALAPGLAAAIRAATYFPAAQHVADPHALVGGLAESFARDGGRIERLAVTGLALADGGVREVETPAGQRAFDTVVLAAGLGSRRFARLLGIALPLVDERGYHVMIEPTGARFEVPVTWGERGFVLTPMETGIRLAGTVELTAPDVAPTWQRAEILSRQARMLFPDLTGSETSRWMGIRPTLPDYLPVIGRAPRQRNLYLALGHQHIGLTTAAATARIIGALVAGGSPGIDIAAFAADRFG
jgi:glycine/D-amino acid oxidase-like deaminating enzyme